MRQIIRPTDCALALCGLFLWAPIASGQGLPSPRGPRTEVTNYLFCVAHEQAGQLTALYYSADFVTTGQNIRPVQDAFLAFLQQKYSYKADPSSVQQISCTGVHSVEESQSILKLYINRDRQDNRYKVIETGWRYPGAVTTRTASTGGAAPPAAPSEGTQPARGAPAAQRRGFSPTDISGVYTGSYQCTSPPHETKFKVSLVVTANGVLTGVVTFDAQGSSGAHPASFSLTGHSIGDSFDSHFAKWETPAPARSMIMGTSAFNVNTSFGLNGAYDPRGSFGQNNPSSDTISGFIDGVVVNPACSFSVKRDDVQSAEPSPSAAAGTSAPANAAPPEHGLQTQNTPPAGTTVAVRMRTGTASTGGAASPAATSAGSSTMGEKSPEALRAEESQDPRLKQMSAEDRQYMLDQGAYAVAYCKNNGLLSGLYSCSCFSQKVFDASIRTNRRTPFVNLISELDYRDCADSAKIEKYGSDREYEVLKTGDPTLSRSQLDQLYACVGSSFASSFQANPVANIGVVDRLFDSANISCHEKAWGAGPSAAAGPSAPANTAPQAQGTSATANPAPRAQSPPQGVPVSGSVEVKVLEPVDSSRDAAGKQFHAMVTQRVNAGSLSIPQGAVATLTLTKAADGNWTVELNSILVAGQPLVVSGVSPTITGSAAQSAANRAGSTLGRLGRLGGIAQGASGAIPGAAPSASGASVLLAPGTSLRFSFSTTATPTTAVPSLPGVGQSGAPLVANKSVKDALGPASRQ